MSALHKSRLSLDGARVLIAEDEALIAMDLEFTIEDHGGELLGPAFNNCEDALQAAKTAQIDVALLDVALLDGDVLPVADELYSRSIPFAFHSGHAMQQRMIDRFPNAGWVVKPSRPGAIVETLVKLIADR